MIRIVREVYRHDGEVRDCFRVECPNPNPKMLSAGFVVYRDDKDSYGYDIVKLLLKDPKKNAILNKDCPNEPIKRICKSILNNEDVTYRDSYKA